MDILDDEDDGAGGSNAPPLTVGELSGAIKRTVEGAFGHVRVRGEIGRVSMPRSGHVYLDLKDDRAVISGVIWKGVAGRLSTRPEEGLEVIATGRLTTFPGQSKYQIVIEDIRPAGAGALMAQLEARRRALAAEGLFDEGRKKRLPYLPEVIGVVTSPSGAVIRDILHRLRDRFPRRVIVWPVRVQGQGSAEEVAAAIRGFDGLAPGGPVPRPDLLIVARGGGSLEDLWGFNDEGVVRAVADCRIPLISAVGHETDTTLIDHAADLRAPTPTAAAEAAVPVRSELIAGLGTLDARLRRGVGEAIRGRGQRLRDVSRGLPRPSQVLEGPGQRLDVAAARLPAALRAVAVRQRGRLARAEGGLRPAALAAALAARRLRVGELAAGLARGLRRTAAGRRADLAGAAGRLPAAALRADARRREALLRTSARLDPAGIARAALARREALERTGARLSAAAARDVRARREAVDDAWRLIDALGYTATLARGYAVVLGPAGEVLPTREAAGAQPRLTLRFGDGDLTARPEEAPARASLARTAKPPPEGQGSLF